MAGRSTWHTTQPLAPGRRTVPGSCLFRVWVLSAAQRGARLVATGGRNWGQWRIDDSGRHGRQTQAPKGKTARTSMVGTQVQGHPSQKGKARRNWSGQCISTGRCQPYQGLAMAGGQDDEACGDGVLPRAKGAVRGFVRGNEGNGDERWREPHREGGRQQDEAGRSRSPATRYEGHYQQQRPPPAPATGSSNEYTRTSTRSIVVFRGHGALRVQYMCSTAHCAGPAVLVQRTAYSAWSVQRCPSVMTPGGITTVGAGLPGWRYRWYWRVKRVLPGLV